MGRCKVYLPDIDQFADEIDIVIKATFDDGTDASEAFLSVWGDETLERLYDTAVSEEYYETADVIDKIRKENNKLKPNK